MEARRAHRIFILRVSSVCIVYMHIDYMLCMYKVYVLCIKRRLEKKNKTKYGDISRYVANLVGLPMFGFPDAHRSCVDTAVRTVLVPCFILLSSLSFNQAIYYVQDKSKNKTKQNNKMGKARNA